MSVLIVKYSDDCTSDQRYAIYKDGKLYACNIQKKDLASFKDMFHLNDKLKGN